MDMEVPIWDITIYVHLKDHYVMHAVRAQYFVISVHREAISNRILVRCGNDCHT